MEKAIEQAKKDVEEFLNSGRFYILRNSNGKIVCMASYNLTENQAKISHVYTPTEERFKYMGEYRYREITVEELYKYAVDNEIDIIIVTAGPGEMHMTSPEQIKPYFDFK